MADVHDAAMNLAEEAELLLRRGQTLAARMRYTEAAELEQRCADQTPEDKPRARGILRVSAVSLWREAGELERAIELAEAYLGAPLTPGFAREVHELLTDCRVDLDAAKRLPQVQEERAAAVRAALERAESALARGTVPLHAVHPRDEKAA